MIDPHQELNIDLPGPIEGLDRSGFFSPPELLFMGFKRVGKNTQISRKCSFYSVSGSIGDNVRIDDFCIFKGEIHLGDYVHICAFCMLSGVAAPLIIDHLSILAARCSVYTASNDHASDRLGAGSPGMPEEYTKQHFGPVKIGIAVLIGAHCVILPNTNIGDCAGIGAGCIVRGNIAEGQMLRAGGAAMPTGSRNVQAIKKLALRVLENHDGEV